MFPLLRNQEESYFLRQFTQFRFPHRPTTHLADLPVVRRCPSSFQRNAERSPWILKSVKKTTTCALPFCIWAFSAASFDPPLFTVQQVSRKHAPVIRNPSGVFLWDCTGHGGGQLKGKQFCFPSRKTNARLCFVGLVQNNPLLFSCDLLVSVSWKSVTHQIVVLDEKYPQYNIFQILKKDLFLSSKKLTL